MRYRLDPLSPTGLSQVIETKIVQSSSFAMKGDPGTDGVGVPSGGTTGQILSKTSNTDFDTEWSTASGTGDMLAATYDPATKAEQVLTIGDLLDEDNMVSDSATKTASQQSIKAYVDAQAGGLAESLAIAYAVSL